MKLRKRQRVLLVLATLALGLGVLAAVHHLRAKRALTAYLKQLVASGEKLTIDEMIPNPAPAEQNGVNNFYRAIPLGNAPHQVFRTNPPLSMTMVAPGKARVGWAQPNIRSSKATNTWEDAIANVDHLSTGLAQLEELIERPNLDFNLNYRQGYTLPLPNLSQTKQAAQQLCHAALCDLHRADSQSATKRVRAAIALSRATADERLVISQLVRFAVTALAATATWELLQSPHVNDEQLASIQNDWERLQFNLPAENAIGMERAMSQMTVEQMRDSSAEFRKVSSGFAWPPAAPTAPASGWVDHAEQFARDTWDRGRLKAKETAWRFSWAYTDQLRTLKGLQAMMESTRFARTNGNYHAALRALEVRMKALGFQELKDEVSPTFGDDVNVRTMFSQSIMSLAPFLKKVVVAEANRQLVVTSVSLQRYKLRHGNYPPDLNALVPEFLPALPQDPVDGKPLRYKPNSGGTFLLYSVGEDGEDNGGDPNPTKPERKSLAWQQCRDWVWPQPATPKEVEDFYQRGFK